MADKLYEIIASVDADMAHWLHEEKKRQNDTIQLIASENFTSAAVMAAQGSIATNKYAEGLPGKRYYGGCEDVDKIETLAIERVKKLFGADFANVQPHSGSGANLAVYSALLEPGDAVLGMDLSAGGHLTHGHPVNFSGKWYQALHYGVTDQGIIDYDQVRTLALKHRPKLLIAGFSAYSQIIDWEIFADIAKESGAYLLADMAHVAGLVAAGVYPSPVPYADIVTSTTHKTLRGPRGGMIFGRENAQIEKAINRAVFPGTQGGPLMHVIAAKGICYLEAMQPAFVDYQRLVIENAQAMAQVLMDEGFDVISGLPQCHMFLLSLDGCELTGAQAQTLLQRAGIIVNKNSIPHDPLPPTQTSGVRIGSAAMTTRGLTVDGAQQIGKIIAQLLKSPNDSMVKKTKALVAECLSSMIVVPDILGV